MSTNVNVTVKFFNDSKGFGFFRQSAKGLPDIFVHLNTLLDCGFVPTDMVMDKPAVVDFVSTPKGLTATRVYSIGSKQAPPTETKAIVDRKDDLVIVKVTEIATGRFLFEIRKDSIDGEQVGDDLLCLVDARQAIGKIIRHPLAANDGKPTNVPGIGPKKGPSPPVPTSGSGQPKKQKKAA